jgi:hypothetical protein
LVGVKLYGTLSNPTTAFVAPGVVVGLAVNSLGVPYVANTKGQIYSKSSGATWTLLTASGSIPTNAKDVIIGPDDDLYMIGKADSKVYK